MANKTPNYDLTKPLPDEFYDVGVQNENMDKIDAALKKQSGDQSTHAKNKNNPHGVTADQVKAVPTSKVGQPSGVASLDAGGHVPKSQIPSLDYIPTTQKGKPGGVATLTDEGKLPPEQGGGIMPQIIVTVDNGSNVTCTNGVITLTKLSDGHCVFDIPSYGTWKIKATKSGKTTGEETVVVDTVMQYPVKLSYFSATLTVTAQAGSTVTVQKGEKVQTKVASGGSAAFTLTESGSYNVHADYEEAASETKGVSVVQDGGSYSVRVNFIVLTVTADSGSNVIVSKNGVTRQAVSHGTAVFYLPSTGTWNVSATLSGQSASGTVNCSAYQNYSIKLDYFKYYGMKIQIGNSNPATACTYLDDATSMTPGAAGWKNASIFKNIRPCVVKNGVVQYYLNPNNLNQKADGGSATITDQNHGDVMIEIPKLGYKITNDGSYVYVYVTDDPNAPGYCYRAHSLDSEGDCDKIYVGAFLGWNNGSRIYSLSGKTPTANITLTNARSYAQARGTGYQLFSFYPMTLLQCLFLLRYRNRHSQSALGKGYTSASSVISTGGTVAKGEDYGEQGGKQQMCFLNIEDFWGNLRQWIDGLYSDGSRNIKTAFKAFNDNGSGYPFSKPGGGSDLSGWISDVQGTNDGGFIVKATSGSGSTYYADNGNLYGGFVGVFGGAWNYGDTAGAFCLDVDYAPSSSGSSLGCRLMYKHKK